MKEMEGERPPTAGKAGRQAGRATVQRHTVPSAATPAFQSDTTVVTEPSLPDLPDATESHTLKRLKGRTTAARIL